MTKLLPVIAISLILAFFADAFSQKHIDRLGNIHYVKKNRIAFIAMVLCMATFVGLRTSCNDTFAYRWAYDLINTKLGVTEGIDWNIGSNPGFNILNRILKRAGFSTQSFLMFYAFVTIGINIWFIRKYSVNIVFTIFLYITMGCFAFSLAAIKQCVAVAFCLIATDRGIKKKYWSFAIWILIAATFHPYSLMYFMVPFLAFRPWSNRGYLMVVIFLLGGFSLRSLMGTLIDITTMMGEEYSASDFIGEGVNKFRVAVVWVPVVLSFLKRDAYKIDGVLANRQACIVTNLAVLNACIMFVGLFGTANYFARLANYFLLFQALALPGIIGLYRDQERLVLTSGAVLGFSGFMYYEEAVANGSFDSHFRSITLIEYVSSLLN